MCSLRVNSAGYVQLTPDWSLTPERTRAWSDFDLWFMLTGKGSVEHGGVTYPLLPGACLLMRGGRDYTFTPLSSKPIRHYWVHFDYLDDMGRALDVQTVPAPGFYRVISGINFVEQLLKRLVVSLHARTDNPGAAELWLQSTLAEITHVDDLLQQAQEPESEWDAHIERICRDIALHPEWNWAVADMAGQLGLSRSYFYKVFMAKTGRSPQQMVIEQRMSLARTLLMESSNTLGTIALQTGYQDIYFFSRQFKQFHGQSPSQYRKGNN